MNSADWINFFIGGGALALVAGIAKLITDLRTGRVMRDDTAIARFKELRDEKAREAAKAWRIVQWYRDNYPRLWAAYMRLPPEDKDAYPPTPPPDIDY